MKAFVSVTLYMVMLVTITCSYPTCQHMQIDGYSYDLTQLPATNLFVVKGGNASGFIDFSFCQPTRLCNNQPTFVNLKQSSSCYIFSSNLNPMLENYTMLDGNAPKKGLKINYLPYVQSEQSTSNTTATITTYYRSIVLNLYCPSVQSTETYCEYTSSSTNTNYIQQTLQCYYPTNGACASIELNYFWSFLSQNKIIFAILLWVMALFQLLFAYLAIRITIFVFGILSGAIFGIIYMAQNYVGFIYQQEGYGIAVFVICLSIFMGVLFGVMLLTLPRLGYVNIGLWVAVIFSLLLQNSVLYLTGTLLAFYITVGVVGLVMTCIALMKLKNYIIVSTSFISAFWLVRPLGFFLSSYPNQFLSGQSYLLNDTTDWRFYLYLISIIILTILGCVFQFCCFKKSAAGNQAYYLQQEGSLKEKFKKLLEFQQVKAFIRSGADQLKFFKQLIVEDSEEASAITTKRNINEVHQYSQSEEISHSSQHHSQESQKQRKKTKLQREMEDYQSKRVKKNQQKKSPEPYFQVKTNNKPQNNQKKNRKVVQVQPLQDFSENLQKISSQEQQQDIKPNKLTGNNKKAKR